jgi:hypothetical protein
VKCLDSRPGLLLPSCSAPSPYVSPKVISGFVDPGFRIRARQRRLLSLWYSRHSTEWTECCLDTDIRRLNAAAAEIANEVRFVFNARKMPSEK